MKNALFALAILLSSFLPNIGNAKSFSVTSDTVTASVTTTATVFDYIINKTMSPLTVKWHVIASNFPADWLTQAAFGICDNTLCYTNVRDTVWNPTTNFGSTFTSSPYGDTTSQGIFDLSLDLSNATTTGCFWMTVDISVPGTIGNDTTVTFVICKSPTAVPTITKSDDIMLYPNPATNQVNLVYGAGADVKTISVYNIIGKLMTVYKTTATNSANLNIDNLSSGIYFARLVNSRGEVTATRKFTKQ